MANIISMPFLILPLLFHFFLLAEGVVPPRKCPMVPKFCKWPYVTKILRLQDDSFVVQILGKMGCVADICLCPLGVGLASDQICSLPSWLVCCIYCSVYTDVSGLHSVVQTLWKPWLRWMRIMSGRQHGRTHDGIILEKGAFVCLPLSSSMGV